MTKKIQAGDDRTIFLDEMYRFKHLADHAMEAVSLFAPGIAIGFAAIATTLLYRSWRYGLDVAPWSEPVAFIGLAAAAFGPAVASRYWGFG